MGALARWTTGHRLRAAYRVGSGARLQGRPDIGGSGRIVIGERFFLLSRPVRSHIFANGDSLITIGDDVQIAYGAAIAAQRAIQIGSNTVLGPFAVIMDNDFHRVGDRNAAGEVAPVRIGSNVQVGARVTILRGTIVGDNVRIMSGSMVSGFVPDGATVGGVPARAVNSAASATGDSMDVAALVQSVLGLAEPPLPTDGPQQIPEWDSLGTLRLLLAIEETLGIALDQDEMRAAITVAALSAVVARKRTDAPISMPITALVQKVLNLAEPPQLSQGPAQIAAWDSLGALRLLLEIEATYGVSLDEREMRAATTVGALAAIVETRLQ